MHVAYNEKYNVLSSRQQTSSHFNSIWSGLCHGVSELCSCICIGEFQNLEDTVMYTSVCINYRLYLFLQVETIGDAYMIVSGVPERSHYHAEHVADLALDMISAMPTLYDPSKSSQHLKIRIGIELLNQS